jgi:hypothetical protein
LIWADAGYSGQEFADWVLEHYGWLVEIVKRSDDAKGFVILPRRWVVERTFGWLSRCRRLSKDYEVLTTTSEAWIYAGRSSSCCSALPVTLPYTCENAVILLKHALTASFSTISSSQMKPTIFMFANPDIATPWSTCRPEPPYRTFVSTASRRCSCRLTHDVPLVGLTVKLSYRAALQNQPRLRINPANETTFELSAR